MQNSLLLNVAPSEYENNSNDFEDTDFSAKLGLDETDESFSNDIIKAPFYENFNFTSI